MHRLHLMSGARSAAWRGSRAVERCRRPTPPSCSPDGAHAALAAAAASSLPHCAPAACIRSSLSASPLSRSLHSSAAVCARPISDWLQFLNDHATPASLMHKLEQALRMMRANPEPPQEREILIVLRKAADAARYVQRQAERDAARWRARQGLDPRLQQSMRVLFTTCVQIMSLARLNQLPLAHWRLDRGTLRAFLILAVRCQAYGPACNLIAHCEAQHPINLAKMETADIVRAVKYDKAVHSQILDDGLLGSVLTALAHSRPTPGPVENVEDVDVSTSLFERVLSSAPASFTPQRSAAMCEDILQRIVALPSADITDLTISSGMLEALSVLFTVHPDPHLRTLVFAKDPRNAQTIKVSHVSSNPSHKKRFVRIGWTNESEDHESFTAQARSLVRAWETYLLARSFAPDFKWPQAINLTNLFLSFLARRAETVTLPLMRSDLLVGVLYASSVRQLEKFPRIFEWMRICFPGPAVNVGGLSYGMDASVWALAMHVLLSPSVPSDEAALLFAEACRVVPRRLQLPLINAYLSYLCEASTETLPERWARMQRVLADAMKAEATPSSAPVALPQTFMDTVRAAWAAAEEQATRDSFPLTQPDLVLYSHVIRMLDRLHEQQVPFTLLAQSTVASPAPLVGDSAMSAFLPLFSAPESSTESDPAASGWQLLADELHHRAQEERDRDADRPRKHLRDRRGDLVESGSRADPTPGPGFFRFNPQTHNLFVPTSGLHAADDQWIHAMCRLACRALQRAGQMKSVFDAQGGGGQPLTLVVETEASPRAISLDAAAASASASAASSSRSSAAAAASDRPSAASSPDTSSASYWRSLSNRPAVVPPVPLPADWLFHYESEVEDRVRNERVAPAFAEWLRPAVRPSERVLHALRAVFDEMGWKQQEPVTVHRPKAQHAPDAATTTHSPNSPAKEFVFTFDAQPQATAALH